MSLITDSDFEMQKIESVLSDDNIEPWHPSLYRALLCTTSNIAHQLRILRYFSTSNNGTTIKANLFDEHSEFFNYWVSVYKDSITFLDVGAYPNFSDDIAKRLIKKSRNSKFHFLTMTGTSDKFGFEKLKDRYNDIGNSTSELRIDLTVKRISPFVA